MEQIRVNGERLSGGQSRAHDIENHLHDERVVQRGSAPFRPQARLIRLLGEELISDEATALLELVKNAYDADARQVTIRFISSFSTIDAIEVLDDGDGMDLETVTSSWLTPAVHRKRGGRWKRRTVMGRFPLGEKGVGRFAADKLGSSMELISRALEAEHEVALTVGWHRFDADAYLDEIESHWEVRSPRVFTGLGHGTCLRIGALRATWNRSLLERVHSALSRLIAPGTGSGDFRIVVEADDFPDLSGEIRNRLLDRAPYQLRGRVDEDGILHVDGGDLRTGTVDLRMQDPDHFIDVEEGPRPLACGPFRVTLHAWDLDTAGLRAAGMDRASRNALKEWSGVSIYRDGFRVLPYGEKDDDWLELNQRRVNNPTLRLSNNQIIGIVEITQRNNPDLRDRTSREGLIDNPAFSDLRHAVLGVFALLEEYRFGARRSTQADHSSVEEEADPVVRALRLLESREGGTGTAALAAAERAYRDRVEDFRQREDNLLRLAGIGVAAERMSHDIAARIARATVLVQVLRNQTAPEPAAPPLLATALDQLDGLLASVEDQLDLLTPLRASSANGRETVDLRAVVQDAIGIFSHRFLQSGIEVLVSQESNPAIYAGRSHILQVLLALFDNAVYWLRQTTVEDHPTLRIHLWAARRHGGLIVADNGPGITPEQANLIFEPSYSTRREGLGLGLFIVQSLLERHGGTIEVLGSNTILPGANLRVRLPLAGAEQDGL